MKILLVSVNARYEHEGLAIWYIKAALSKHGMMAETVVSTINDDPIRLFSDIVTQKPDLIAFSCYIWNRDRMLKLCSDLRKVMPHAVLVAGGPEMTGDAVAEMFIQAGLDYVLVGEGEEKLPELIDMLSAGKTPDPETVLRWRQAEVVLPVTSIPSPFLPEHLAGLTGRIAYMEASRGCPYRCSYCLSSTSGKVRAFPLERVFHEMDLLMASGAKVIKFVDRTFNLDTKRFVAICEHIKRQASALHRFHFEVAPDLLNEVQIETLASMPAGLIQIEAGIQSVHDKTLAAVNRRMDAELAMKQLKRVVDAGNVHVHVDLIAGLPHESMVMFQESFNRVFPIGAHHLQLGFLKLLHGTKMREVADILGYHYREYPPYEVISSDVLSAEDLLLLKDVEETTERFINSGRFTGTIVKLMSLGKRPYDVVAELVCWQKEKGYMARSVSPSGLYQCMADYLKASFPQETSKDMLYSLSEDFIRATHNTVLPEWAIVPAVLPTPELLQSIWPHEADYQRMSVRERKKRYALLETGEQNRMTLIDTLKIDPVTDLGCKRLVTDALQSVPESVE